MTKESELPPPEKEAGPGPLKPSTLSMIVEDLLDGFRVAGLVVLSVAVAGLIYWLLP